MKRFEGEKEDELGNQVGSDADNKRHWHNKYFGALVDVTDRVGWGWVGEGRVERECGEELVEKEAGRAEVEPEAETEVEGDVEFGDDVDIDVERVEQVGREADKNVRGLVRGEGKESSFELGSSEMGLEAEEPRIEVFGRPR